MHALASKAVNKDRELSSRSKFYYEVEENETWLQKLKKYIRTFVTFFFTQVPLILVYITDKALLLYYRLKRGPSKVLDHKKLFFIQ